MQRFTVILVVVVCTLMFTSADASAQTLTKSGTCPGLMTFQVTGAQPFARLAYIHAANTGSWAIPGGVICGTTVTGLAAPVVLAGWATADAAGNKTITTNIPPFPCNRYLQVVDTTVCTLTNVVQIN